MLIVRPRPGLGGLRNASSMHVPHRLFLGLPSNGFRCIHSAGGRAADRPAQGAGRNSDRVNERLGQAGRTGLHTRLSPLAHLDLCVSGRAASALLPVTLASTCLPPSPLFIALTPPPLCSFPSGLLYFLRCGILSIPIPSPPFLLTILSFPLSFYHLALSHVLPTALLTASLIVTSCPFPHGSVTTRIALWTER